jgi:hypothetical protein
MEARWNVEQYDDDLDGVGLSMNKLQRAVPINPKLPKYVQDYSGFQTCL